MPFEDALIRAAEARLDMVKEKAPEEFIRKVGACMQAHASTCAHRYACGWGMSVRLLCVKGARVRDPMALLLQLHLEPSRHAYRPLACVRLGPVARDAHGRRHHAGVHAALPSAGTCMCPPAHLHARLPSPVLLLARAMPWAGWVLRRPPPAERGRHRPPQCAAGDHGAEDGQQPRAVLPHPAAQPGARAGQHAQHGAARCRGVIWYCRVPQDHCLCFLGRYLCPGRHGPAHMQVHADV